MKQKRKDEKMKASDYCKKKTKAFEGLRLSAYRDSGGVLTIGYGHTLGVKAGQRITQAQADAYFERDMANVEAYLNKTGLKLTQGGFDACADFIFNLGSYKFSGSTLFRKIRAKAPLSEIQKEFRRWVYGKKNGLTVRLPGLVERRDWEARRFAE